MKYRIHIFYCYRYFIIMAMILFGFSSCTVDDITDFPKPEDKLYLPIAEGFRASYIGDSTFLLSIEKESGLGVTIGNGYFYNIRYRIFDEISNKTSYQWIRYDDPTERSIELKTDTLIVSGKQTVIGTDLPLFSFKDSVGTVHERTFLSKESNQGFTYRNTLSGVIDTLVVNGRKLNKIILVRHEKIAFFNSLGKLEPFFYRTLRNELNYYQNGFGLVKSENQGPGKWRVFEQNFAFNPQIQ